jgi:hypothetical protein
VAGDVQERAKMKKPNSAAVILGVLLGSLTHGFAQTNIQIIGVAPTIEQAIQLTWTSASNHTYEIDEADALATNADGSTAWNMLYNDYPSQGTNTFWLDTGNYVQAPPIIHPRFSPMRFYRIIDSGLDTTSDEPTVSIVTPTNGFVASGNLTITVTASTDQAVVGTTLYVDGQEMPPSIDGSNYILNTCEWPNGPHTLFATATCESAFGGTPFVPIAVGHAVSAFVPVTFNNLVTMISFSQPFFNPAAGQTQMVTAIFPSNVNWTLNIVDASTNVFQTASGSGGSMQYNWDGTDTNGVTVPPGTYYYLISAATNGLALPSVSGGTNTGGGGGGPPSMGLPSLLGRGSISGASGTISIPLPPFPPGMPLPLDAEGNEITNILLPCVPTGLPAASRSGLFTGAASPEDSSGGSGNPPPSPQTNPPAPARPPTSPVAGVAGTFGVAYETYTGSANGTNGYNLAIPLNGLGFGPIQLNGISGSVANAPPLPAYKTEVSDFSLSMRQRAWSPSFVLADNQFAIGQLRGAGNIFNSVNLGVLCGHADYGNSADYTANGCKQMYFPITAGTSVQWLRMSEMNFGGAGPGGLKWMALFGCYSLYRNNWQDMQSHNVKPYNSNLHLLLGLQTIGYIHDHGYIMAYWADQMFGLPAPNPVAPLSVRAAWYAGARKAYLLPTIDLPPGTVITFAVAGDAACKDDTLQTNSSPTGTAFYDSNQVYP